jgi:adenylate cyclase
LADIFVSYARQDRRLVVPIVAALQAQGWSVWWDPEIAPGQEFDRLIADELDAARAVVVVWTPASTASRWVKGEARDAADRGILAPVRFDGARLPIDVRSIHTTDFDGWSGDPKSPPFRELCRAIAGSNLVTCWPHRPGSRACNAGTGTGAGRLATGVARALRQCCPLSPAKRSAGCP